MTYAQYALFRNAVGRATLVPSRNLVEGLAVVKDAEELASISRAVEISDGYFWKFFRCFVPA